MNSAQMFDCIYSVTDEEVDRLHQFREFPEKIELGAIYDKIAPNMTKYDFDGVGHVKGTGVEGEEVIEVEIINSFGKEHADLNEEFTEVRENFFKQIRKTSNSKKPGMEMAGIDVTNLSTTTQIGYLLVILISIFALMLYFF